MNAAVARGSCLCGAISFRTHGRLREVVYCHCSQCRKQSGHYFAATNVSDGAIEVVGSDMLNWYAASPQARRGFCRNCGSVRNALKFVGPDALFLSVVTIGEIRQGIESLRRRDEPQARTLDDWLLEVTLQYRERVLGIDVAVAAEWGRLRAIRSLPVVDAFLAATARVHQLTLVTRNERDFTGLGVDTLNPSRS